MRAATSRTRVLTHKYSCVCLCVCTNACKCDCAHAMSQYDVIWCGAHYFAKSTQTYSFQSNMQCALLFCVLMKSDVKSTYQVFECTRYSATLVFRNTLQCALLLLVLCLNLIQCLLQILHKGAENKKKKQQSVFILKHLK